MGDGCRFQPLYLPGCTCQLVAAIEVQPPEGRTPGDLRAMLVTLKPFLAQARGILMGGKKEAVFFLVM